MATRRRARLRRLVGQRGVVDALVVLASLADAVGDTGTALGGFVAGVVDGSLANSVGSSRELFPLPVASAASRIWPTNASARAQGLLLHLVDASVAGLNYLHSSGNCKSVPTFVSSVQVAALTRCSLSWWRLAKHMAADGVVLRVPDAYQTLVNKATSSLYAPLRAEFVDMCVVKSMLTFFCQLRSSKLCTTPMQCFTMTWMMSGARRVSGAVLGPSTSCSCVASVALTKLNWCGNADTLFMFSPCGKKAPIGLEKFGTAVS